MNRYFFSAERIRVPFAGFFFLSFSCTFQAKDDQEAEQFVGRLLGYARRIPFLSYASSKWGRAEALEAETSEERDYN